MDDHQYSSHPMNYNPEMCGSEMYDPKMPHLEKPMTFLDFLWELWMVCLDFVDYGKDVFRATKKEFAASNELLNSCL